MLKPVSGVIYILIPFLIAATVSVPGYSQPKRATPDKAAQLVLDSARRSYSSGLFDTAAERFGEFIRRYPKHAQGPSAYYGLGLSLLKKGQHADITNAVNAFRAASGRMDFTDRPLAIYYLGVSLRDLATSTLAQKVTSGSDYRASNARTYRHEAARHFAGAADAFVARSRKSPATTTPAVHPDLVWASRAKADQCDVYLRLKQYKQAVILAAEILKDPVASKLFGDRAIYNMGYAYFSMKDYLSAGRTLGRLAPFKQSFGPHGRYLLARTHHLGGDKPESLKLYKAVMDDYAARKAAAVAAAKSNYRSLPSRQRAAAEKLVAGYKPAYVVRTMFYSGAGLAESGRFANALTVFSQFLTEYPKHPLAPEAQMRLGYCHLQIRSYDEAIKALDPMRKHPKLTERAQWWIARARIGSANPELPQEYANILETAITELKAAAQSARNSARNNPKAYVLEKDILMELGDAQMLAGKHKDACTTYGSMLQYNSTHRVEEASQRLATAYHLAGDYSRSDRTCDDFQKRYPKSMLIPAIWFRSAENALMSAVHYRRSGYNRSREDIDAMYKEAVNRYQRLLGKFPDFSEAHLARYGLATAQYRLGWYEEAMATVSAIPEADRSGKLAAVPYLMADCHIRTFPKTTDNALTAGKLMTQATKAIKLLEAFASGQAKSPRAPDALLKLGYCCQRLGSVVADPAARKNAYTQGKDAYARLIKNYSTDPLVPTAMAEQAKCMVLLGDSKSALNELDRFQREPFRSKSTAPLAITQFSSLLRAHGRAIDAARIAKDCLTLHEKDMSSDPVRRAWLPALRYEYALAVMDTGNLPDAQELFSSLNRKYPKSPEGLNALWRMGQCQRRELKAFMDALAKTGGAAGTDSDVDKKASRAASNTATAANTLIAQAKVVAKTAKGSNAHLRLIYEAAWCHRILGQREVESARRQLQKDTMYVTRSRLAPGSSRKPPPTNLAPPRILLEDLPLQKSETRAIELYQELIAAAPQGSLAARTRFELSEMFAQRRKHDEAVELLETLLENNPPGELAQMARLRLAACLLDRGDHKRATALAKVASAKAKGQQVGHVQYIIGEAYMLQKEWSKAIEQLRVFRDEDTYRRMSSIVDKALLRLGYAYEQTGNWGESRRSFDSVGSYAPRSPWIYEAQFGSAWARENSNDLTNALSVYASITTKTFCRSAARSQLRIGHCYLKQKKYPEAAKAFMVVPYTYNYPDICAEAWFQAGVAHLQSKKTAEAENAWKQLLRYHPESKLNAQAKELLSKATPEPAKKNS